MGPVIEHPKHEPPRPQDDVPFQPLSISASGLRGPMAETGTERLRRSIQRLIRKLLGGKVYVRPAQSIFNNAPNFCRSAIAVAILPMPGGPPLPLAPPCNRQRLLPVTAGERQCSAIKDVIKFAGPARRKIAPPPQRPLWRQLLGGLETRALALQRD